MVLKRWLGESRAWRGRKLRVQNARPWERERWRVVVVWCKLGVMVSFSSGQEGEAGAKSTMTVDPIFIKARLPVSGETTKESVVGESQASSREQSGEQIQLGTRRGGVLPAVVEMKQAAHRWGPAWQ
jgi:hypothetical protein